MMEDAFFFARREARLFGLLHRPAVSGARLGFVLSHPFAEEKLWSHRVFVSLARALAARGYPVLRFDYAGAGDSSGRTAETSLATHMDDLRAAVERLGSDAPELERIGLIGLRLGATLAARLAEEVADDAVTTVLRGAPLVLCDPVLDGAAYLQEVLRANLSAQLATHGKVIETREVMSQRIADGGVVNVDGYEIAKPLFDSIGDRQLLTTDPKRHRGPTLVVAITPPGKPAKPQPALEALASAYTGGEVRSVEEHQFWREIKQFYGRAARLQETTLDWIEAQRG
jgi:uncharacterized protein